MTASPFAGARQASCRARPRSLPPATPPGAQQARRLADKRHDGRFQPDRAWSRVEHERHRVAELLDHVLGAGRADAAGAVGARRGQRPAERGDRPPAAGPRGARSAMVESPAVTSGCTGAASASGTTSDKRPRPEFLRQLLGARVEHAVAPRHLQARHVADQRIEARPPLGLEDARHRLAVRRVRREAVDGLRRQRDERAGAERRRRFPGGVGKVAVGDDDVAQARDPYDRAGSWPGAGRQSSPAGMTETNARGHKGGRGDASCTVRRYRTSRLR